MPKPHTFPTLYDELKTVSISFLTKHAYLKPNQYKSGTITWSRDGNKTGSISIQVNTQNETPYLLLDYKCNEVPINYRVQLVSTLSNLGKGVVWFFICPYTGKRCRKLYLADTYFYHRSAFRGLYERQTYSRKDRRLDIGFRLLFGTDKAFERIYSKHFKTHYASKPTKQYLKLIQKIKASQTISEQDLINLLLS